MFDQHSYYAQKQNATFEQRAIAVVIDTTILGLIVSFLESVIGYAQFVGLLYYVFSQLYYGYSPGKYITGLRVISTTGQTSVIKMFFRESFGKFFSIILLGAGFLSVMFRSDRLALHDKLSSTRVITLKPQNVSGMAQLARGMASIALIGFIIAGFSYYSILFSDMMAHRIASALEARGFMVMGASGCISKGFYIKKISKEEENRYFELNDISFQFSAEQSGLKKLSALKEKIVLDHLNIGSGLLKVQGEEGAPEIFGAAAVVGTLNLVASSPLAPESNEPPEQIEAEIFNEKQEKSPQHLEIKSLEVSDFKIQYNNHNLIFDRVSMANVLSPGNGEGTADHFYISSNLGTAYFKNLLFNKPKKLFSYDFEGSIKGNNPFFTFLRTDLDFSGRVASEGSSFVFDLKAFNNTILISKMSKGLSVNLVNLNFRKFFKKRMPISYVNVRYRDMFISGDIKLRNKVIKFQPTSVLALLAGPLRGEIKGYGPVALDLNRILSKKPWLLVPDMRGRPKKITSYDLAEIYLNKPYEKLGVKSKKKIRSDYKFFSRGPLYKFASELKKRRKKARLPASSKKNN